jgi:branched-chain amino acid aminotransferase
MPAYINYNGKLLPADQPILAAGSRALRYGDGLFETMRMTNGAIPLATYHFERLFAGLQLLHFEPGVHFTPAMLLQEIQKLCSKNNCHTSARIRLTCFRAHGGLFDPEHHKPQFLIEAWPLALPLQLNENGLVTGLYPYAQKSPDAFANCKTNNALLYAMAAHYAKAQQWNDALVLNTKGFVADSSIANIFLVKDKTLFTPPLSEGCIAGTMRRHLLTALPPLGYTVAEQALSASLLHNAEEIWLTNAIHGIRWVQSFETTTCTNKVAAAVYKQIIVPLWQMQ